MHASEFIGAVDIGGTKIGAGLIDRCGRILARRSCATEPARGFDDAVVRIQRMLSEARLEVPGRLTGIGIGSTGPVDPVRGTIEDADMLPGWRGACLTAELERTFHVPVALENDADAAALAEAAWGLGRGKRRLIYVTISTGIGAGMVFDGRLYRGVDGSHPELGHITLDDSQERCYCGARGCWESLASGPALARWAQAQQTPGGAPSEFLTAQQVCRLAQEGDELALRAVDRAAYYLGLGLANLIISFCPDAIALGGGVMNSAGLFLDRAREVIARNCRLVPHQAAVIAQAVLGADAPLAGAAQAWHHRYETNPD